MFIYIHEIISIHEALLSHLFIFVKNNFEISVKLQKPLITPCLPAGRDYGSMTPIRNALSGSVGSAFEQGKRTLEDLS